MIYHTASDVRACIQNHYGLGGEKYAVLFEVPNATGAASTRSIDAVVMSLWPSLGLHLNGMEIKVSRGDWLRELGNPKKASDVWHHFDKWWLVAHADVAKEEEIPEPWGWLIPDLEKKTLKIKKQAPINKEVRTLGRSMLASLMRRVARKDDAAIQILIDERLKIQKDELDKNVEARAARSLGDLKTKGESWDKLTALLKETPNDYIYSPDVIRAVRLVMRSGLNNNHGGLRGIATELENLKTRVNKMADKLGVDPAGNKNDD